MLTYKAIYKFVDGGAHAEVLDFPGAISAGRDLDDARTMLGSGLVDMAETNLLEGKPLLAPSRRDGFFYRRPAGTTWSDVPGAQVFESAGRLLRD